MSFIHYVMYSTCAAHDGKVTCTTVEYTTAFLYSHWLHFSIAWYKIKYSTENTYILLDVLVQLKTLNSLRCLSQGQNCWR